MMIVSLQSIKKIILVQKSLRKKKNPELNDKHLEVMMRQSIKPSWYFLLKILKTQA